MHTAAQICDAVQTAYHEQTPLKVVGNQSKSFLGQASEGIEIHTGKLCGIQSYEPTELILTVNAGTLLSDVMDTLDQHEQILAFEPPAYDPRATIGGTIACGLSGPARAFRGAARDFVLGCRVINGKGEHLKFGGQVMKNVAGYDISRLMVGAQGTLGLLTEISMKVLPRPKHQTTIRIEHSDTNTLYETMASLAARPWPISGLCAYRHEIYMRIDDSDEVSGKYIHQLERGEVDKNGIWFQSNEHQHPFFQTDLPLWRISVPSTTPQIVLKDTDISDWFIDWAGGLRWLRSTLPAEDILSTVEAAGGHARCFRTSETSGNVASAMPQALVHLHSRIKHAFDPSGILNPGLLPV